MPKPWRTLVLPSIASGVAALVLLVPGPSLAAAGQRSGATAPRLGSKVDRAQLQTQAGVVDVALQLVGKVFIKLRDTATGQGANAVVGGALGGLLKVAAALGVPLEKSQLAQVKDQLDALQAQITELQTHVGRLEGRLEKTHASQLLHASDPTTSLIESAMKKLRFIADHPGDRSPGLVTELTRQVEQLSSAPEYFNHFLNSRLADNPIKATSRALAVTSRFFSHRQSAQVRAVFDYYATYEAELAILLTNYWNAHGGFSVAYRTKHITEIEASIMAIERDSVPAAVPAGTFIDTKTPGFMWGTDNREVNGTVVVQDDLQTRSDLRILGFGNWQMGSFPDYRTLVHGASENARLWLQSETGVSLERQLVWGFNSITIQPPPFPLGHRFYRAQARVFDLKSGKEELFDRGVGFHSWELFTLCKAPKSCLANQSKNQGQEFKSFLEAKRAGLLLLRHLRPGERYWFGAA